MKHFLIDLLRGIAMGIGLAMLIFTLYHYMQVNFEYPS